MKNYFTVPVGIFLSFIGIMKLLLLLNTASTINSIIAIVGIMVIFLIIIKTKIFTNFSLRKTKNKEK